MSQPHELKPIIFAPFERQRSHGPKYKRQSVANTITPEQKMQKIQDFEEEKKKYLQELRELKDKQYTTLKNDITKNYKVYYFIGRLNPPHNGHIEALDFLIKKAQRENPDGNYKVIILLGSGPGKNQTLNDPLPFGFKRSVVIDLLRTNGIPDIDNLIDSRKVLIEEMDRAAEQIAAEIRIKILEVEQFISKVNKFILDTYRVSSTKEGDDKKLNWIEQSLQNSIGQLLNIQLTTRVVGIVAIENEGQIAMSATKVRKDALRNFITDGLVINRVGPGYLSFVAKYGRFYGSHIEAVYGAIVDQADGLSEAEIQAYIDTTKLPKTKKKGGSRKRRKTKRKLTNRRKSRKHRKSKRRRH